MNAPTPTIWGKEFLRQIELLNEAQRKFDAFMKAMVTGGDTIPPEFLPEYQVQFMDADSGTWCEDGGSRTTNFGWASDWFKDARKRVPIENHNMFRLVKIEDLSATQV